MQRTSPTPIGLAAKRETKECRRVSTKVGERFFVGEALDCFAKREPAEKLDRLRRIAAAAAQQSEKTAAGRAEAQSLTAAVLGSPKQGLPDLPRGWRGASQAALRASAARDAGIIANVAEPGEAAAEVEILSAVSGWAGGTAAWRCRRALRRAADYQFQTQVAARLAVAEAVAGVERSTAESQALNLGGMRGKPAAWAPAAWREVAERVRSFVPPVLDSREHYESRKAAATRIQSVQRKRVARIEAARRRVERDEMQREKQAATSIQSTWRARGARVEAAKRKENRTQRRQLDNAATKIQNQWRGREARGRVSRIRFDRSLSRLQRVFRGRHARAVLSRVHQRESASSAIQRAYRSRVARKETSKRRADRDERARATDAGKQRRQRKSN
eukprot:Hpha_TRINITY_DN4694_c0_g1::TRINITY_DN4694_c0_g1_i1::g.97139::m.97139